MPPYKLEKCITIQWPELDTWENSYVCIIIIFTNNIISEKNIANLFIMFQVMLGGDPSLAKLFNIIFHERGNSEILTTTNSMANRIYISFPTSGV